MCRWDCYSQQRGTKHPVSFHREEQWTHFINTPRVNGTGVAVRDGVVSHKTEVTESVRVTVSVSHKTACHSWSENEGVEPAPRAKTGQM